MKKFTLMTLLVALFSMTAFAQKSMLRGEMMKAMTQTSLVKGLDRKAQPIQSATRRAASDELVVLPTEAEVETMYTSGGKFYVASSGSWADKTSSMASVNVAIVGNDFYLQGLAYWFTEGWMKGTIDGTTVTFPQGQLIGSDDYGPEYIVGSNDGSNLSDNIVFNYDAEAGTLTAVTTFIIESAAADQLSIYTYWHQAAFSKTAPEMPEAVVVPESAVVEDYIMGYTDSEDNAASIPVKVAVDGNDVYVQGLSYYIPEAWVKGTLEGNEVTFAKMQYMGEYGSYGSSYAFYNGPAVFIYDAEKGSYAAEGEIYGVLADSYYDGHYFNPVLSKVTEVAGVPATPSITAVGETNYGPAMQFAVPLVDVEGNAMVAEKVSLLFFYDIEGETDTLVFHAADYSKLEEDMTVIPYGFTEDYDFYNDMIYLNMAEYSQFNRLAIQSIYTGGGVENKSEINWFVVKPYSKVIFDFNAMTDEPCSSSESNAGDITEDRTFTDESEIVAMTVSPSTTDTPNRFWNTNKGPQLRIYGGTLTFESSLDKVITKITFNAGKWNEGNSADTGAFEGSVWTGEAKKVVVTIAGNTQLNSIVVETADFVPTAVEAPENLETETYAFEAIAVEASYTGEENDPEPYSAQVEVGFDGDDLYIQGLAADDPELWVKATKNAEGKYVIPANQYMGTLDYYGLFSFDYFFTALDEEGDPADVVLTYDAEAGKFTTDQTLVLNGSLTEFDPYLTFTNVSITKIADVAATPADPSVDAAGFSASNYPYADFTIPAVGTNGETLLSSKLFYSIYVEKDGVQSVYTFDAESYARDFEEDVVEVPYSHDGYDFYGSGSRVYFEVENEEFATWTKIGVQSIYYGGGECKKSNIVWGENAATGIAGVNAEQGKVVVYNLAGQRLNAPRKGLNIINGKKVLVK